MPYIHSFPVSPFFVVVVVLYERQSKHMFFLLIRLIINLSHSLERIFSFSLLAMPYGHTRLNYALRCGSMCVLYIFTHYIFSFTSFVLYNIRKAMSCLSHHSPGFPSICVPFGFLFFCCALCEYISECCGIHVQQISEKKK